MGGNIAVNVHGTRAPDTLTWSDIIRTMFLLWSALVSGELIKTCSFQLFFEGGELGRGEISSTAVAGNRQISPS